MKKREFTAEIGGKVLTVVLSDLAGAANGAAMMKCGDTVVLATAVMGDHPRENVEFFPLTVDYEERFYASGEILGSRFFRREGKPSDTAILSGRLIDRAIRPLFDHRLRHDVQIVVTVLALGEEDPDMLALNATSLALALSDIPWQGPISGVRVVLTDDGRVIVNPKLNAAPGRTLELVVAGKDGTINMIEAAAKEIDEEEIEEALTFALKELSAVEKFQKEIISAAGIEKRAVEFRELSDDVEALFNKIIIPRLLAAVLSGAAGHASIDALRDEWLLLVKEKMLVVPRGLLIARYESAVRELLHREALEGGKRADGRALDELRPLFAEAGGFSAALHGTGIFYRGDTHVLSVLTLGGPDAAQVVDGIETKETRRFMHHYNFPPFAAGETGRIGSANRREIGHGALVERALSAVLPDEHSFPYTLRIVSESMASNGSTSMASVCASTLALMDGGVPITRPVAGVAMGLMMGRDDEYRVLTDIQGPEDQHGDMDFKVAGTSDGVTALQLDVKVEGVPLVVLATALARAKDARMTILEVMEQALAAPRTSVAASAPRVVIASIPRDKIGSLIGPGGKIVNGIRKESGVTALTVDDEGTVTIVGRGDSTNHALEKVEAIARDHRGSGIQRAA